MTPRTLITAQDDVISSVAELMRIAEVRHVPVRDGGQFVGIVSTMARGGGPPPVRSRGERAAPL